MADQLVTVGQVKTRAEITDASDDALLTELIEEVTDWIEWHTGRRFIAEAGATYVFDTASGSELAIPRGIRAVSSIAVASTDQPDTGGTYGTPLSAANVLLRPSSIERAPGWPATRVLIRGTTPVFSNAINGVTITGDFGFAAVPPMIQAIAIDAVMAAYAARQGGDSDVAGPEGSPIASWARYFAVGTVQRETLDRYRGGAGIGFA